MTKPENEQKVALYRSALKNEGDYQYIMAVYPVEDDTDYVVWEESEGCKPQPSIRTESLEKAIKFADAEELPEE